MLAGNSALEPVAWAQLNKVRGEIANDAEALDALGVPMAKRGEEQAVAELFKKVLALDASNLTALSNLGALMAKQNKLDDSRRLLSAAFSRNQDLPRLALNLARVDCIAGDGEAATRTLKTALLYNPGLESLEKLRSQVLHCPITDVR